jgi:hypothetical protein
VSNAVGSRFGATALALSFFGDGARHLIQLLAHNNTMPENVRSIPTCFLTPILAVTVLSRRRTAAPTARDAPRQADRVNDLSRAGAAEMTGARVSPRI